MKKMVFFVFMMIVFVLVGCENTNPDEVILPDLEGYHKDEIEEVFEDLGVEIYFVYNKATVIEESEMFIGYGQFYLAGDQFNVTQELPIIIYDEYIDLSAYFFYDEIDYDGPYLDIELYNGIDPIDPRGGYFSVENPVCTDGDTAVFDYPNDIYQLITSGAKSTRFLNMDTPETYPDGEEEWGKPASLYTCLLLNDAEDIILQTDPGDNLTGNYGRLLAWVWVKLDGEDQYFLLNYMVVRQGLGEVAYEYGAGETISYGAYTYNEWMHLAEDRARADEYGQWGNLLDYYWDYEDDSPNENWN
ncbi:MAG: thermonuclease family protein [Candidatus Izemoplasmataceae bacterium]